MNESVNCCPFLCVSPATDPSRNYPPSHPMGCALAPHDPAKDKWKSMDGFLK